MFYYMFATPHQTTWIRTKPQTPIILIKFFGLGVCKHTVTYKRSKRHMKQTVTYTKPPNITDIYIYVSDKERHKHPTTKTHETPHNNLKRNLKYFFFGGGLLGCRCGVCVGCVIMCLQTSTYNDKRHKRKNNDAKQRNSDVNDTNDIQTT